MSKYVKDKSEYIKYYNEAEGAKEKTNERRSVLDSHPLVCQLKGRLRTCDIIIKALNRSEATLNRSEDIIDARRLIVGFEAYKEQCLHKLYNLIAKIEAGAQMDADNAGNVTRSEKRIIKATREELECNTDNYKYIIRKKGKNRDDSGKKVRAYLGSEVKLAEALCYEYWNHQSFSVLDIKKMLARQRKISNKIANKEAYGMDL